MATRREIKRRIRSISNTAQITKAMQMVAAARMRRAQQRVEASRPYAENINDIVADIASRPGAQDHPLLARRPVDSVDIVTITPDRGLAGALVGNLNRETLRLRRDLDTSTRIIAVGRKGRDFAVRAGMDLAGYYTNLGDHPSIADIAPIAREVLDDYETGTADAVYLIYSEFISTLRQQAKAVQLIPVIPPAEATVRSS
ncbi:MAG: F0F1 ATP synthase subunit gamma, partial [Chloroflexota bacterium]